MCGGQALNPIGPDVKNVYDLRLYEVWKFGGMVKWPLFLRRAPWRATLAGEVHQRVDSIHAWVAAFRADTIIRHDSIVGAVAAVVAVVDHARLRPPLIIVLGAGESEVSRAQSSVNAVPRFPHIRE